MYTGNSINPSVHNQNINNTISNPYLYNRPTGFALIQVQHTKPTIPLSGLQDSSKMQQISDVLDKNGLSNTQRQDIAQIINLLNTQKLPEQKLSEHVHISNIPLKDNNTQSLAKEEKLQADVPINNQYDMNAIDDKTAFALAIGLGGVLTGMVLQNKFFSPIPTAKLNLSQADIAENVIKIIPELIKSIATGTTMLAAAVGVSRWLNQETPERLKIRLDAIRGS